MSIAEQGLQASPEELKKQAAYSGDPWKPSNPYFAQAEASMADLWRRLIYPFIQDCDYSNVLDLAAGHGRNSAMLLPLVKTLHIMDIQSGNIEACRKRFSDVSNISYYTNNGFDMQPIDGASLSLVYSFDAMVHFESDVVRSYLRDTYRVLKAGGRGFFHHSNYTGGSDWKANPGSRNFMSKQLFEHYAYKEGLKVIQQRVINWGAHEDIDCLTLVEK